MFIEKDAIDNAITDVGDVKNSTEKASHCVVDIWKTVKERWNKARICIHRARQEVVQKKVWEGMSEVAAYLTDVTQHLSICDYVDENSLEGNGHL